jgi:hypothetical protein
MRQGGEKVRMSHLSTKSALRVATGILVAAFALSLASVGRAQSVAQSEGDSSASASAAPAKNAQQQLDDLQKEMSAIEQQIAVLKAQENAAPSIRAASYVQAPAAAPEASKVNLAGLLGPTTISGLVDAYYGYNYNHPIDNISGWRYFDGPTNAFGLNMVEMIVDKAPDSSSPESRFGYHVAAGYGNAAYVVNSSDILTDGANFYLKEAYGQYLAPIGKGLTFQVGKFVTPIGGEVIESSGNWNYSRGILFYYAIPYFHFGVNAKYTWNPKFSSTFYLVNGWNNSAISHDFESGQSAGLTYGGSFAYTPNAKWSVIENYMAGPVQDAYTCDFTDSSNCTSLNDWKQITDTVISYTPNSKWAFMLNGDYGFGPKNWDCTDTEPIACATVGHQSTWWGVAGYGKYTINPKSYLAMRYEYYGDPQGYSGLVGAPGFGQEATGTYSYNITSGLQVRAEYRYDFASQPFFQKGADFNNLVKEQNTATLGFIYSFSSANAK